VLRVKRNGERVLGITAPFTAKSDPINGALTRTTSERSGHILRSHRTTWPTHARYNAQHRPCGVGSLTQ
jgi:hypothetical protein